ncbi:MAG: hypothetical protein N2441_07285 [Rhodocyclaceae bacterium]|nr:hypothetical protein [Rhodocyclaceae bacterium]
MADATASDAQTLSEVELAALIAAVQHNCDISDARYAREATLCSYLLEMRELYRWRHGLPWGARLPHAHVGAWIRAREAYWETLSEADYAPIVLAGKAQDPFDVETINACLAPHGLVYGAGVGRFGKPVFFLARLIRSVREEGFEVQICGEEFARDLSVMPAALQRGTAVVRQRALAQWLWEKAEAWLAKRRPGPMERALLAYGFEGDHECALARMIEAETETLILHERGEWRAARILGPSWERKLMQLTSRRAEILLRAVRDNLADCLVTLPTLIEREALASLWLWLANFDGMRRALFPALGAIDADEIGAGRLQLLARAARQGTRHFEALACRLMKSSIEEIDAIASAPEQIALSRF